MVTRAAVVAAIVAASLALNAQAGDAHPLHTTLTELSIDPVHHTLRAVVRVFSDDVGSALARRTGGRNAAASKNPADADASAYILSTMTATNHAAPIALRSCGVKRSGDLLWVCVEGDALGDGKGLALKNAVLCELFSDQVNIVQVTAVAGASPRSVLFTRGDGAKSLL